MKHDQGLNPVSSRVMSPERCFGHGSWVKGYDQHQLFSQHVYDNRTGIGFTSAHAVHSIHDQKCINCIDSVTNSIASLRLIGLFIPFLFYRRSEIHLNSIIRSMSSVDFSFMYLLTLHTNVLTYFIWPCRSYKYHCFWKSDGEKDRNRVLDADGSGKVLRSRFKFCAS